MLVGGSSRLPSLADKLYNLLPESTILTRQLDPDEVIARGLALQGLSLLDSTRASQHTQSLSEPSVHSPSTLSHPIGLVVDGSFHPLIPATTPLPLRRIFDLGAAGAASQLLVALFEGTHEVVSVPPAPKPAKKAGWFGGKAADDDEEDDDEPEDVKESRYEAKAQLAELVVDVAQAAKGKPAAKVRVTVTVDVGGKGSVSASQVGVEGAKVAQASF